MVMHHSIRNDGRLVFLALGDHVGSTKECVKVAKVIIAKFAILRCIVLVHLTPSGEGLRFVCKACKADGNLADNAKKYAARFGLTLDEACKDSSRGSFVCTHEDIIYMNPEIYDYEDKNYDDEFGKTYRRGAPLSSP